MQDQKNRMFQLFCENFINPILEQYGYHMDDKPNERIVIKKIGTNVSYTLMDQKTFFLLGIDSINWYLSKFLANPENYEEPF